MNNWIRIIGLIIFFVLPVHLMAQSINPDVIKMQAMLEKGKALFQTGDLEGAISQFKKADDLEPGLASLDLAKAYKILGNSADQYTYLARHLKSGYKIPRKDIMLDPVFSDLDRNREWIRFWSERWYSDQEELVAECEYRLSKNDLDPDFWFGTITAFQDDAVIIALLAQYYSVVNDNKKAEQNFRKALSIEPNNEEILFKYATFLYEIGKKGAAGDAYSQLISIQPYEIKYYLLRAKTLIGSGAGRGVEEIERLKEFGIDASDLNLLIAKDLIEKDPDKAISYLDPILQSSPSTLAFNLRAQSRVAIGNIDDAISDYAMSLDIDPRQPDVYFNRAKLRLQQGDNEGACYDWSHALQLGHRKAADMLHKHCR